MSVTTVRLQPEVEEGLEAMAGKLRRTKSWLSIRRSGSTCSARSRMKAGGKKP